MIRIEIGRRNYFLYLVLPHPVKLSLMSADERARLDRINREAAERTFSGDAATRYDEIHRYGGDAQHEYPGRLLVDEVWAPDGYGRTLELGAGSGYFTTMIARRARHVVAVEPVPDMQKVLAERCAAEGVDNVEVLGISAFDVAEHVAPGSLDSVVVIQSLHHFHRRPELFATLGRLVRPGGTLYAVEPHHNIGRAIRVARKYFTMYRPRGVGRDALRWATHDFVTRRELAGLCRVGGFAPRRISTFWFPRARALAPDPRARFRIERALGRIPALRHVGAVLALEARRASS